MMRAILTNRKQKKKEKKRRNEMKFVKEVRPMVLTAAVLALTLVLAGQVYAGGTDSGTDIDNLATVTYNVGTVAQTEIESAPGPGGNTTPGNGNGAVTTFKVDNKIDLTVARVDGSAVSVNPGENEVVLEFTVTNNGNTTQDYDLTAVVAAAGDGSGLGNTDGFDMDNVQVFAEEGTTSGYQPGPGAGTDTDDYIDELAQDTSHTVYIVADTPLVDNEAPDAGSVLDGKFSVYHLRATTNEGGSAASQGAVTTDDSGVADDPAAVQVVFADGQGTDTANDAANDGEHSDDDDYEVAGAQLTVTKTSDIISDPINNTTNPKRIPGATVEYTLTIANAGGASSAADSVVTVDNIPTNTTYTAASMTVNKDAGGALALDDDNAGESLPGSPEQYDVIGDHNASNAGAVTIEMEDVEAGESYVIKFRITID